MYLIFQDLEAVVDDEDIKLLLKMINWILRKILTAFENKTIKIKLKIYLVSL